MSIPMMTEEYGHISDAFDNLPEEEFLINNQMIDIQIRQSNPNCLVYYTITLGDWIYEGDALDINSALTTIQHNLQHNCPKTNG